MIPNVPVPTKPVKVPQKGIETLLSPEELQLQQRLFSAPETLPDAFKSWVVNYIAVNGSPIPPSQVLGLRSSRAVQSQILTSESTASTTYTDLATVGPTISGLSDGTYLLTFGCIFNSAAGGDGYMSVSSNAATPSDNDAAFANASAAGRFNIVRAVLVTLSNQNNNSVNMQYRVTSGTNSFRYRWLIAQRVGN